MNIGKSQNSSSLAFEEPGTGQLNALRENSPILSAFQELKLGLKAGDGKIGDLLTSFERTLAFFE
jgi:hypothetical protein